MACITTCSKCNKLYEETSEEYANDPNSKCLICFRENQKQNSRNADEQLISNGEMTAEQVDRKNSFLRADRTIVHWDRAKKL